MCRWCRRVWPRTCRPARRWGRSGRRIPIAETASLSRWCRGRATTATSGSRAPALLTNTTFDFEDKDSFGVHIRATDRGGLSFQRVLMVRVTDVAEAPRVPPVPSVPSVSIGDVSLTEGNIGTGTALFTVSLSPTSAQQVTVAFATADGSATTSGSDYQAASGTLSFAPGETSKTIGVLVNGDTVIEPNETFTVSLSSAVGASIGDGQATGTITNDDANAAPVAADDAYTVAEDAVLTVAAPGVLGNDTDADGDPLTAQLVYRPVERDADAERRTAPSPTHRTRTSTGPTASPTVRATAWLLTRRRSRSRSRRSTMRRSRSTTATARARTRPCRCRRRVCSATTSTSTATRSRPCSSPARQSAR